MFDLLFTLLVAALLLIGVHKAVLITINTVKRTLISFSKITTSNKVVINRQLEPVLALSDGIENKDVSQTYLKMFANSVNISSFKTFADIEYEKLQKEAKEKQRLESLLKMTQTSSYLGINNLIGENPNKKAMKKSLPKEESTSDIKDDREMMDYFDQLEEEILPTDENILAGIYPGQMI